MIGGPGLRFSVTSGTGRIGRTGFWSRGTIGRTRSGAPSASPNSNDRNFGLTTGTLAGKERETCFLFCELPSAVFLIEELVFRSQIR